MKEESIKTKKRMSDHKKLIDDLGIEEPDYKYWFKMDHWTMSDAACLLNGIDPDPKEDNAYRLEEGIPTFDEWRHIGDFSSSPSSREREYFFERLFQKVIIEKKVIETWGTSNVNHPPITLVNRYLIEFEFIPYEMLKFAKEAFLKLYQGRKDSETAHPTMADFPGDSVAKRIRNNNAPHPGEWGALPIYKGGKSLLSDNAGAGENPFTPGYWFLTPAGSGTKSHTRTEATLGTVVPPSIPHA